MVIKPNQPTPSPANQPEALSRDQIIETTTRMLGGVSPFLSFGVAQQEALLKAMLAGANPDHERSVRTATHHVETVDPSLEAVAVVHAGMVHVAAVKAGLHPADAGLFASEVLATIFGPQEDEEAPCDETDNDY